MMDFYLRIFRDAVDVYRISNDGLELIRFKGEQYVPTCDFWPLFKDKIEYVEGDKLCLVQAHQGEPLTLPEDVGIAEGFHVSEEILRDIVEQAQDNGFIVDSCPALPFTQVSDAVPPCVNEQVYRAHNGCSQSQLDPAQPAVVGLGDSMQAFYRQKTRRYKRGQP